MSAKTSSSISLNVHTRPETEPKVTVHIFPLDSPDDDHNDFVSLGLNFDRESISIFFADVGKLREFAHEVSKQSRLAYNRARRAAKESA